MADMIEYSTAILNAVVTFLGSPPVFYLFALICFVPIFKIVKGLLKI